MCHVRARARMKPVSYTTQEVWTVMQTLGQTGWQASWVCTLGEP